MQLTTAPLDGLWLPCLAAAVAAFVIGRRFVIPATAGTMAVAWFLQIPFDLWSQPGVEDIPPGWWFGVYLVGEILLRTTLVGGAAAVGLGLRLVAAHDVALESAAGHAAPRRQVMRHAATGVVVAAAVLAVLGVGTLVFLRLFVAN